MSIHDQILADPRYQRADAKRYAVEAKARQRARAQAQRLRERAERAYEKAMVKVRALESAATRHGDNDVGPAAGSKYIDDVYFGIMAELTTPEQSATSRCIYEQRAAEDERERAEHSAAILAKIGGAS